MAAHETTWLDLLRHGEPAGGLRFRGHRDDPLTELGWQQLRDAVGSGRWDCIVTSDLRRCHAFATVLAEEHGTPLHVDSRFRELDFGDWEGVAPDDIPDQAALRAFWERPEDNPPPGGESMTHLLQRVGQGLEDWLERAGGQRILVVCHAGVIRAALAASLSIALADVMRSFQVPYACRSRLRIDRGPGSDFRCLTAHGAFD
ncbi:alpha-ribazole phosphatase [Natronocella acetinitrilica]|uniref:Alpha-ribazole phosphatase n=1 Tax=Natronocella acetinitrilica TaxID=414046 RepID=A0AAE3G0R1_9GAMM|nr:histidine phosphatase family protein [Natronocella acetinitrilica]MCP1673262.1 alpha-ribazole phosphatase [Natronocella acetinitrilica]